MRYQIDFDIKMTGEKGAGSMTALNSDIYTIAVVPDSDRVYAASQGVCGILH